MASIKPITVQEKKDLEKFTKFLALKAAQIIVQSRLGKKISTQGKSCTTSSDWFNLAIMDLPDVLAETKRAIRSELGGTPQLPLCVEISLRTVEGDSMVLETWCLSSINEPYDTSTMVIATYTIYNRMGILLRSLLAITRTTPAYKLSRRQSPDSYVICYRIYQGEPQFHNLGDGYQQTRVGQIVTPVGTLHFSVTYRTKMTISPTQIGNSNNSIMVKSDHFQQNDNSADQLRNDEENYVVIMNKPLKRGTFFVRPEEHFTPPETPKPFEKLFEKPITNSVNNNQSAIQQPCTDMTLPKSIPKTFSFNYPLKKREDSVEELRPLKIAFANCELDEGPKVANLYWYFKEARTIDSFQECLPLGEQDLIQEMEKHQKQTNSYSAVVKEFLRPSKDEEEEDSDDDYFSQILDFERKKSSSNSSYRKKEKYNKQNKENIDSNGLSSSKSDNSQTSVAGSAVSNSELTETKLSSSPKILSCSPTKLQISTNHNTISTNADEDTNNNKNLGN